ncbi:MAG: TlpA disulfide reductase family protein [Hyphomonadaceae bacterium]
MRQTYITGLALTALLLTACSAPATDAPPPDLALDETQAETHAQGGVSTDPNGATGFITLNAATPDTAEITREDGILRDTDGRPYHQPLLGQSLPAFTGTMADGTIFNSGDLSRWTVIEVWGLWCEDSMADAPYAGALNTAIAQDPDLDFMSIHTLFEPTQDRRLFGEYPSVSAYFDDVGYSFPTVIDDDASIRELLQVGWTPSYFLISPDGVVRGYRTDMAVHKDGEPVKDFLRDIARVRGEYRRTGDNPLPAEALYTIGPEGVAGLRGPTVFTLPAIEKAFAGLTVTPGTGMVEDEEYPTYWVSGPESALTASNPLYVVEPTWDRGTVAAVLTHSFNVSGPLGERIGETRYGDIPVSERLVCSEGLEQYSGILYCASDAHAGFWRFFRAEDTMINLTENSPKDILDNAILIEMRYQPPTPGEE